MIDTDYIDYHTRGHKGGYASPKGYNLPEGKRCDECGGKLRWRCFPFTNSVQGLSLIFCSKKCKVAWMGKQQ